MKSRILGFILLFQILAGASAAIFGQIYTGVVSFGDSLSDIGNTITRLSAFGEPNVRALTGYNSNFYYNDRLSNGLLWSERLNDQLGFGTMARNNGTDVLNGTNFAWAGSTSGVGNTGFLLPNLQPQIAFYTGQIGSNAFLPAPAATLYTIWSGGNDVINLVGGTPVTPEQVADNIATAMTALYNAGGRTFLVPNLPPLGEKPDFRSDPVKRQTANDFVDSYNLILENTLASLAVTLVGSDIISLDVHTLFVDAIAHPENYGLTNVTQPAYTPFSGEDPPPPYGSVVANPGQYLFWDNSHGTTTVYSIIADMAYQAVVPEPSVFVLLALGAAAGILGRRMLMRQRAGGP